MDKLYALAFPAMTMGLKKALSRKIVFVCSVTEDGMPPITPANAIAPLLSAITKSFLDNLTFVSFNK